ncbi:MAG: hypothetical protein HY862_17500 [Chloroflexi bacterium]|nr:hypothetical protein [Chloroflexota bacterium]
MAEQMQSCDWCGASWHIHWKCQIICPTCGAKQDCSDLFVDYDKIQRQREAYPVTSTQVTPTQSSEVNHDRA